MQMADKKPLWEVMDDAVWNELKRGGLVRQIRAAEIRAIADEVERRGALGLDLDPLPETADWLRAEAERAEKGDANG
jgi:hypothetical protein